jgi:hypothetical protein
MRVELKIGGGFAHFPGLAHPLVVNAAQLPGEAAAELRHLCASAIAHAATRPAVPGAPTPDARTYRLTIADESGTREIACEDPIGKGPLAELIAFVRTHGSR